MFQDQMETSISIIIHSKNENENNHLQKVIRKIEVISPIWKDLLILDDQSHKHQAPQLKQNDLRVNETIIVAQSLSINLLLRPEIISKKITKEIQNMFVMKPWKFHHKFQVYDTSQCKVIAKQTFYELTKSYPLFAPSVYHTGPTVLRFNIFVNENFIEMKNFYSHLLKRYPAYEKDKFCYFSLNAMDGFEVQLSLKYSKQLVITDTTQSYLQIYLDNVYENLQDIGAKIEDIYCSECGILLIRDPENNPVLVRGIPHLYVDTEQVNYKVNNQEEAIISAGFKDDIIYDDKLYHVCSQQDTVRSHHLGNDHLVSKCKIIKNEPSQLQSMHIMSAQRSSLLEKIKLSYANASPDEKPYVNCVAFV